MSGKHSPKNNFVTPPPRGGWGGLCAVCGGAETREGKAPAGGYGGIIEPPARVATMRTQFPERVTNPQNKGTFAKRLKMPSRRII